MSGFIRVKELPTRYEVGCEVYWDKTEAASALTEARGPERSNDYKLTVIRRWQVKRTEVTEDRYEYTCWTTPTLKTVIEVVLRKNDRWHVEPQDSCADSVHMSREEAEAAARKWLRDNGYRIRKVAA